METKTLDRDAFGEEFALVTDSQEIEAVVADLPQGEREAGDWGCLFVKAVDGDYVEVWAMESAVPWLGGLVHRLLPRDGAPGEPLVLEEGSSASAFPESVEVEITPDLGVASRRGHLLENPLALALTDRLGTRYGVSLSGGGRCLAQPWDDPDPALAASENAPWYDFGPRGCAFLRAFDAGEEVRHWHTAWFIAIRE